MSLDFIRETDEFQDLVKRIGRNETGLHVNGVNAPARPYFLAALLQETGKKIVFIRPVSYSLAHFKNRSRFFLERFSPDLHPMNVPPLSESPYQDIAPSLDAISSRMDFFYKLLYSWPPLVISNLPGLLKPMPHPDKLQDYFLELELGSSMARECILQKISDFGYGLEDLINSHGEYAWRGGIVDVFSPWGTYPFRIEFSGDEIVSLREFDPASQRSVRRLTSVIIPSLREFPGDLEFLSGWKNKALSQSSAAVKRNVHRISEEIHSGNFPPSFAYYALLQKDCFVPYTEYLKDYIFVIEDFPRVEKEWNATCDRLQKQYKKARQEQKFGLPPENIFSSELWKQLKKNAVHLNELPVFSSSRPVDFHFQSVPRFDNKIPFFLEYLGKQQQKRERCVIFFSSPGVRKKLSALLSQHQILFKESDTSVQTPRQGEVELMLGDLPRGYAYPPLKVIWFSEQDIFTAERVLVSRPRVKPFISHFRDLKAGDFVVHTDYGIGIFAGLIKMEVEKRNREFLRILYKEDDKLFVPMEDLNLVQKYSQTGSSAPMLSKLGTPQWERVKAKTKIAIESMARELLELYAKRKSVKGFGFSPLGEWQSDFDKTFEFQETEDQLRTINDIRDDMESNSPMDRLLCGDVGYGKTEVAVRAAFIAVMDGKQVAVLCPTTVLASQHLKTFRRRMLLFPVRVEGLSRLQSRGEQIKVLADVKQGLVDIVVGTHRLLSQDVEFKDLGLLVVDEEQRFGVKHKERIKRFKTNIDVLTMTATPIPRTLNLALSGLRDISLIESPPKDRLAIHTVVTTFSRELIISAINKELDRGGQVYFIHNRIDDIDSMAAMLARWIPQAKVVVAHGRMTGVSLEKRMIDFVQQKFNVLMSTTIIENGIDIPMVNTLIVNRADRFGLAQLYQLRGRVGRSSRQAAAYFLVPSLAGLTPHARERLVALQEFSELGSGFRLAAKDLEIRGAGNFLGSRQHGLMEAVGFDYYMHLLDKTVKKFKGEEDIDIKCEFNLKTDIRIPEAYLPQVNLRLNLYKRISSVEDFLEIKRIQDEVLDRYGPLPSQVRNLFLYGTARFLARKIKIKTVDRVGHKLIFKFFPESSADLTGLTGLLEKYSGSITPQGVMSLKLAAKGDTEIMNETVFILKELSLI